MTGLDKIIGQINQESADAAAKIIEAANAESGTILEEARVKAQTECEKIGKDSERAVADLLARTVSAATLKKRKAVLSEKQRLIGEIIDQAKASLGVLPEVDYFGIIEKMIHKSALAQAGEILFSAKDYTRLPEGFEAVVAAAAIEKGGSLTISSETRNLDGGFVLIYGGVEENCSFAALFDSAHESLQDRVSKLLFQ